MFISFILAVLLAWFGAFVSATYTIKGASRVAHQTERGKRNAENFYTALALLNDVANGFHRFILTDGDRRTDQLDAQQSEKLQKLIDTKAFGKATADLDNFNDYVNQQKATLQNQKKPWKNTEELNREVKKRFATAQQAIEDWFNALE